MKKILLVLLLFSLVGCSSLPTIAVESNYVTDQMNSGTPLNDIRSVNMNAVQTMRLNHAITAYETFKAKWNIAARLPVDLEASSEEFRKDYSGLRQHVLNVETVVFELWVDYNAATKVRLLEYLSHVKKLDVAVNHFYMEKRYWEAAKTSLLIIASLLELSTKAVL